MAKTPVRSKKRPFRAWFRRWAATSKPTEWIGSITGMVATIGGIISGAYLWKSGYLDSKKSEANTQLNVAKIELFKVEQQKIQVDESIKKSQAEVVATNNAIQRAREELESTNLKLTISNMERTRVSGQLDDYKNKFRELEVEKQAIRKLRELKFVKGTPAPQIIVDMGQDLRSTKIEIYCHTSEDRTTTNPVDLEDKHYIFEQIRQIASLQVLYIDGLKLDVSDVALVGGMSRLYALKLSNCGLTDELLQKLSLPSETYWLDLSRNPITKVPNGGRSDLIHLNLNRTKVGDNELKQLIARFPKIHNLFLDYTQITEISLEMIRNMKELEEFIVPRKLITDELAMLMMKAGDPSSKYASDIFTGAKLDLTGTQITDQGLEKLKKFRGVTTIEIANTNVTDAGLIHLAEYPDIMVVRMENTKITKEGLDKFCFAMKDKVHNDNRLLIVVDIDLANQFYSMKKTWENKGILVGTVSKDQ